MTTFLTILTILLASAAIFLTGRPYIPAVIPAFLSLCTLCWAGIIHPSTSTLTGWGTVAAVMLITELMQPQQISKATNGTIHISAGALVGMATGLSTMSTATMLWTVAGSLAGATLGAVAYARTAAAAPLAFPSPRFWRYAMAKVFPIAVTYSLLGLLAFHYILARHTQLLINID